MTMHLLLNFLPMPWRVGLFGGTTFALLSAWISQAIGGNALPIRILRGYSVVVLIFWASLGAIGTIAVSVGGVGFALWIVWKIVLGMWDIIVNLMIPVARLLLHR